MSSDEMRVALAEWAGWADIRQHWNDSGHPNDYHWQTLGKSPEGHTEELPALTLDWLHELEARLTDEEWDTYMDHFIASYDEGDIRAAVSLGADEKAALLCKALGLWKEAA